MHVELATAPKCLQEAIQQALAKEKVAPAKSPASPPQTQARPFPEAVRLTIYGHAKPSVRITEKGKKDKKAAAYLAWQKLVSEHCLFVPERPVPWEFVEVEMLFYFIPPTGKAITHGDRINLGKSTEDGLAWGGMFPEKNGKQDDSCVMNGNVGIRFCLKPENERVEITIREFKMPEPVD